MSMHSFRRCTGSFLMLELACHQEASTTSASGKHLTGRKCKAAGLRDGRPNFTSPALAHWTLPLSSTRQQSPVSASYRMHFHSHRIRRLQV